MEYTELIEVGFDIRKDISQDIGNTHGRRREFSSGDIDRIADCVYVRMEHARKMYIKRMKLKFPQYKPTEYEYVIKFFGDIHPGIFASLCICLYEWEEVFGIWYDQPHGIPCKVFPQVDCKVDYVKANA